MAVPAEGERDVAAGGGLEGAGGTRAGGGKGDRTGRRGGGAGEGAGTQAAPPSDAVWYVIALRMRRHDSRLSSEKQQRQQTTAEAGPFRIRQPARFV